MKKFSFLFLVLTFVVAVTGCDSRKVDLDAYKSIDKPATTAPATTTAPEATPTPTTTTPAPETPAPEVKSFIYDIDGIAPGAELQPDGKTRYWQSRGNSETDYLMPRDSLVTQRPENTTWVVDAIFKASRAARDEFFLVKPYLFRLQPLEETPLAISATFALDKANNLWSIKNGVYEKGSKDFTHLPSADGTVQKSVIKGSPYEVALQEYGYNPNAFNALFVSHDGRENMIYTVVFRDASGKEIARQSFEGVKLDPTGSPTHDLRGKKKEDVTYEGTEWSAEAPFGTETRDERNVIIPIPRNWDGEVTIETPALIKGETCLLWVGTLVVDDSTAKAVEQSVDPEKGNGGAVIFFFQ